MSGKGLRRIWAKSVDKYMASHGEWKSSAMILDECRMITSGKRLRSTRNAPLKSELWEYFRGNNSYEYAQMEELGQYWITITGKKVTDCNMYRWIE